MTAADVVNPPPPVQLLSYPIAIGVTLAVALTCLLLFVAGKFDPTQGVLTISVMIVLGMLGATGYCLLFTVPVDDITPGIVGGLTAGFGAVVAHWLGRSQNNPPSPPAGKNEPPA